jgi:hypothetical protein
MAIGGGVGFRRLSIGIVGGGCVVYTDGRSQGGAVFARLSRLEGMVTVALHGDRLVDFGLQGGCRREFLEIGGYRRRS